MRSTFRVIMFVLVLLIVTAAVYFALIGPQLRRVDQFQAQIREVGQRVDLTEGKLKSSPRPAEAEHQLWESLDAHNRTILFDETTMVRTVSDLAAMANKNGAVLTAVSIADPINPDAPPPPRRGGRRGDAPLPPVKPQMMGSVEVKSYPVRLAVQGRYAAWASMMSDMSSNMVPAILTGFDTQFTGEAQIMIIELLVPVRQGDSADVPVQQIKPIAINSAMAHAYRLDLLQAPIMPGYSPIDSDPFPLVIPAVVPRPALVVPKWSLTAVVKRDGTSMAVVNTETGPKVLAVGTRIGGHELIQITPETAIFKRID